jgi:hypothetical protein
MRGHTIARKGRRIQIILCDAFIDKLVEDKAKYKYYVFEREGRVMIHQASEALLWTSSTHFRSTTISGFFQSLA